MTTFRESAVPMRVAKGLTRAYHYHLPSDTPFDLSGGPGDEAVDQKVPSVALSRDRNRCIAPEGCGTLLVHMDRLDGLISVPSTPRHRASVGQCEQELSGQNLPSNPQHQLSLDKESAWVLILRGNTRG